MPHERPPGARLVVIVRFAELSNQLLTAPKLGSHGEVAMSDVMNRCSIVSRLQPHRGEHVVVVIHELKTIVGHPPPES